MAVLRYIFREEGESLKNLAGRVEQNIIRLNSIADPRIFRQTFVANGKVEQRIYHRGIIAQYHEGKYKMADHSGNHFGRSDGFILVTDQFFDTEKYGTMALVCEGIKSVRLDELQSASNLEKKIPKNIS